MDIKKELSNKKLSDADKVLLEYIAKEMSDPDFAVQVNQDHKTYKKMFRFLQDHARTHAVNGCAMIQDNVVFGWVKEYFAKDDKAEADAEAKKAAETKAAAEKKKQDKAKEKQERRDKETGQMNLFDLM